MFKYLCLLFVCVECVFHIKSGVTFKPYRYDTKKPADFFGYSVVLNKSEIFIGAPKANSISNPTNTTGLVYKCKLQLNVKNVMCKSFGLANEDSDLIFRRFMVTSDFFKNDMWFGSTIAVVPGGKFLMCAPRYATPYKNTHLLMNGGCYVQGQKRGNTLLPLKEMNRQAFMTDGSREEFGEYGTHLNFYAYGQAGMSVKVTENNTVIIGAPGLLQWTGGVIEYKFYPDSVETSSLFFSKQPVTNPYYTKDLGPDDYLGYSVESGVFEANGKTLYIAGAPRSKSGFGQVLIFEPSFKELDPIKIKAKLVGDQLGSYFGATLCCTDINGDGVIDLLVGAPNYVHKNDTITYDQGAVFVYLTEQRFQDSFTLRAVGFVRGSSESGAHFGLTIADLGDVDGDGYSDVAIGAPWEDNGSGAVYIYRGSETGLNNKYIQRIQVAGAKTFGGSISKGVDVDNNNCNDLAVGAFKSDTAYVFRCIPTVHVEVSIRVPDAMNLQPNATNFTAQFCIKTTEKIMWPHVKLDLKATVEVDSEGNRAMLDGDPVYSVSIKPGNEMCEEQIVKVHPTADLSNPISMKFNLAPSETFQDSKSFPSHAARLSDDSILSTSFDIQLTRDCGDDLICRPLLHMTLESLDSPYIPGTNHRLGLKINIMNKEEASYGALIHLTVPSSPKRLPSVCSLVNYNVTCKLPSPFYRGESVEWEIEVEYTQTEDNNKEIPIEVELHVPFYRGTDMEKVVKQLTIFVTPKASFSISGKPLPNATISVSRDKFNDRDRIHFVHNFEVINLGPSDCFNLSTQLLIPDKVNISNKIKGCSEGPVIECSWSIPAKVSLPILVPLYIDLDRFGVFLEENPIYNITTSLILVDEINRMLNITTTLSLEPAQPIWPVIVGCIAGILLLAVIVFVMYKYGFFSRQRREDLKRLQEQCQSEPSTSLCDVNFAAEESSTELLSDSE
ncbi:integrin alpha-PS3 [Pieris rapae]|uniref:integrin alpha-PS3 n=1 Tax=Pieris rapae TaxID=64459 RepID=UPI001E280E36|nr:integrin alpha-PS3 [Pieris rapae]